MFSRFMASFNSPKTSVFHINWTIADCSLPCRLYDLTMRGSRLHTDDISSFRAVLTGPPLLNQLYSDVIGMSLLRGARSYRYLGSSGNSSHVVVRRGFVNDRQLWALLVGGGPFALSSQCREACWPRWGFGLVIRYVPLLCVVPLSFPVRTTSFAILHEHQSYSVHDFLLCLVILCYDLPPYERCSPFYL